MLKTRVLIVEDDALAQERYRQILKEARPDRFDWRITATLEEALSLLGRKLFDIIVLDINLSSRSGLDVLRWREKHVPIKQTPVLIVSGRVAPRDKVAGLQAGADDYLSKPFDNDEFLARVDALKRRCDASFIHHGLYRLGWLIFEPDSCVVTIDGSIVHFEPKELALLVYFLRRPRIVHRSAALWDMFWNEENSRFEHVLENKISSLRRKLGRGKVCLKNHKGIGYSFDPNEIATPA